MKFLLDESAEFRIAAFLAGQVYCVGAQFALEAARLFPAMGNAVGASQILERVRGRSPEVDVRLSHHPQSRSVSLTQPLFQQNLLGDVHAGSGLAVGPLV